MFGFGKPSAKKENDTPAPAPAAKPTRQDREADLGQNAAFLSLTQGTQNELLDVIEGLSEMEALQALQQLRQMDTQSRDGVVGGLLNRGVGPQDAGEKKQYTVQPGDSLSRIGQRYGVSLAQIKALNPQIKNFDLIHPADVINLS